MNNQAASSNVVWKEIKSEPKIIISLLLPWIRLKPWHITYSEFHGFRPRKGDFKQIYLAQIDETLCRYLILLKGCCLKTSFVRKRNSFFFKNAKKMNSIFCDLLVTMPSKHCVGKLAHSGNEKNFIKKISLTE